MKKVKETSFRRSGFINDFRLILSKNYSSNFEKSTKKFSLQIDF
tara:strand:+ start:137 stop:268 length:132 start_codon:yes stop_codon:yes gene_type:complete